MFRFIFSPGSTLVHVRRSGLPVRGLTFWNVPKSVDFHQTNGCNSGAFASMCYLVISVPRRLAYKRSNLQHSNISHNILPSNGAKSSLYSKSKEVRFDTSLAIHFYRDGISDTTKHSQGTSRSHQTIFFSQTQVWHELFFLFWGSSVQQQTSFS